MERNIQQIKQKVNELISNALEENKMLESYEGKSLIEDLEMDSIALMETVAGIEQCFGIDFEKADSLIQLLDDYDMLIDYILQECENE